jgi:hypothetical protein
VRRAAALVLVLQLSTARADESVAREADFRHVSDYAWFVLGAAAGFVGHELGHVLTDVFFGKSISFVPVYLGPIPFFAIQPCCHLTHREEYVIGSAGFLVGDISSELILQFSPRIRARRQAFLKGVLMFDIVLAVGYAVSGFAGVGPPQSDVNTMARGLEVPAWQVGLMLVVPASVDLYRYFVPRSAWAPWTSVTGKALLLGASFAF